MTNSIKVLKRPAKINKNDSLLINKEFYKVRRCYHKFIDFEQEHEKILEEVTKSITPNLIRASTLISRLKLRKVKKERSTDKQLDYHPNILKSLENLRESLKNERNKSQEWQDALKWDQQCISQEEFDSSNISLKIKRKNANESNEEFEIRAKKDNAILSKDENGKLVASKLPTRREAFEKLLYKDIEFFYDSFSEMKETIKQAKSTVLKERKLGKSARIRRPNINNSFRLYFQIKHNIFNSKTNFKIEKLDKNWWQIFLPIGKNNTTTNKIYIPIKFKGGNWHVLPDDAKCVEVTLIRKRNNNGYKYSISITFSGSFKDSKVFATTGSVGFDWGHRQTNNEIKGFTTFGTDDIGSNISLPLRNIMDKKIKIQSQLDTVFNAKNLNFKNRYLYRKYKMYGCINKTERLFGCLTKDESEWFSYETLCERQITKLNNKINNIRNEVYISSIRKLRMNYKDFYMEDITGNKFKVLNKNEMSNHKMRQNRDIVARYKFLEVCKRYDANLLKVNPINSTKKCPFCLCINKKSKNQILACDNCGKVRDRDNGAAMNILREGIIQTECKKIITDENLKFKKLNKNKKQILKNKIVTKIISDKTLFPFSLKTSKEEVSSIISDIFSSANSRALVSTNVLEALES